MNKDILACYEQAQEIGQGHITNNMVKNSTLHPHWIEKSFSFWYLRDTDRGQEYRLVDSQTVTNCPAFDHQALAYLLVNATGENIDPYDFTFEKTTITLSPFKMYFQGFGKNWLYEPESERLEKLNTALYNSEELDSPDGKKTAFVRDHNLWVIDKVTGEEHALTRDGVEGKSYSTAEAGEFFVNQARWSPDSNRLFAVQWDSRDIPEHSITVYAPADGALLPQPGQPLNVSRVGDECVDSYKLVVADIITKQLNIVDYSSLSRHIIKEPMCGFFGSKFGWWSTDSQHAYFLDVKNGSKIVRLVKVDTFTGITCVLFEETSNTFVRTRYSSLEMPIFMPLPESDELIWFSERSGWGHLYLYDLNTGKLKNVITEGDWLVRSLHHYDSSRREIVICTGGRDPKISPYFRDICRVNIDTGDLTTIVSGNFDCMVSEPHNINEYNRITFRLDSDGMKGVSPCGSYIVFMRGRVDTPSENVLIDRQGLELLTIETADVSGLPSDWVWPDPVKMKGDDGETDIYGVVYRPPGFSPDKVYPVVDYSCSARNADMLPQVSFGGGNILGFCYYSASSLAALGFIVIQINGRGTPNRNKAFIDHQYGDFSASNELKDHIAGIRQLAQQYPYIDLNRVGISGDENRQNSAYALLKYSNFYKVAVVNQHEDVWGGARIIDDEWFGTADETAKKNKSDPTDYVDTFDGKLLLITGMLGLGVPAGFRLVDALQNANKDFDQLFLPNLGYGMTAYTKRREWDYLVEHLQKIVPPKTFQLARGEELAMDRLNSILARPIVDNQD